MKKTIMTKEQIIEQIKAETPTLKTGSDEYGYTDLTTEEYEAHVLDSAERRFAKQGQKIEAEQAVVDKEALLIKLGITANEAKLLLS